MLLAVAEHKQLKSEIIPRIATGFCGGLAHTRGTCGAVSAGVMGISLYLGRDLPTERNERCYAAVQEFIGKFSARFGDINCLTLTGVDLDTAEGQAAFEEKGLKNLCTEYVGYAAGLVLEIVEGNDSLQG